MDRSAVPKTAGMRRNPADAPRLRVSLRQLEAFCAVSRAGSVSAAARSLSRTQSAVSAALGEFERAIGTPLFERAGRGLRATDAARRLLPRALEMVERAEELPAIAAGTPGGSEHLRVGASRTIGPFVMPSLLARFDAARPRASIELTVANTAVLLDRLRRVELDVAFVEGDVLAPGLQLTPWAEDALCLFARPGHPLARRFAGRALPRAARTYGSALAEARWALREPGSGTRETFLRAIAPAIGAPRIGVTVDDPLALQRAVAAGDWLGCMSRRAVADAFADGRLVELPAPDAAVRSALLRRFWIVQLPERYRSAALDALLGLALASTRSASRRAGGPRRTPRAD